MKKRKTYQTKKEAQEAREVKGWHVYEVKNGWRIRKRSKPKKQLKRKKVVSVKAYTRQKARNNKGQFQTIDTKVNLFIDKVLKVHDLIEDYWRTKGVRDDIVRQKSLAKIETNWQLVINILNEELISLENKISDLIK